jgi:predicted phage gp36 major capsid-like protein
MRETDLRKVIEEADKKYLIVIGKLNAAEEYRTQLKEAEARNGNCEERVRRLEMSIDEAEKEKKSVMRERDRLNEQLEKTLLMSREF